MALISRMEIKDSHPAFQGLIPAMLAMAHPPSEGGRLYHFFPCAAHKCKLEMGGVCQYQDLKGQEFHCKSQEPCGLLLWC